MSYRTLWQIQNFRRLFTASIGTNLGDGVLTVALPWFATLLTRDPFLIGLVAMSRTLPWLLFALPMGVITDRHDRRLLILLADSLRLGLVLAVLALAYLASPGTPAVLALASLTFLLGTAEVLRDNTAQSVLPLIVPPALLERANGYLWTAEELTGRFLGPPLAGAMITFALVLPFGFFSAMVLFSVIILARSHLPTAPKGADAPFWHALKEGLRHLIARPALRRLAMVLALFNFLYSMSAAVLVLYAQEILGLGAVGYGALLSAQALGGLSGSLIGPGMIARLGPSRSLVFSMSGFIAISGALFVGAPVWLIAALLLVDGLTGMIWNITTVSYRQRSVPPELFGRVNAAYRFIGSGAMPLGALTGGALVGLLDAPFGAAALHLPFGLAAAGGIGMMAYAIRRLRIE